MMTTENEFGKWRSILFPIHTHELKKLVPLALIFLFISFNYSMLRGLKDVFVLNKLSKDSIYVLKVMVIPSVILFTALYTFIAKRVNRDVRFNIVIIYFFMFFCLFYIVLLPKCESLELVGVQEWLSAKFPKFSHWWKCIRVWPISLFYIHAEVWGTLVLGVAFWTFANEIVSSVQAKRVYPFLMVGAGVGGILSGVFLFFFNKWENLQIGLALVLIVWILGVYNILARNIAKSPVAYGIEQRAPRLKASLTFIQSIKVLLSSRYLLLVACVVFGYNMFVVFLESVWKSCAGLYSESLVTSFLDIPGATMSAARSYSKTKMTGIYGLQSIFTGVMSLLWIFFVAGPVSKKSWKFTALFTPLLAMVMSLAFWLFCSYGGSFGSGEFKGTHIFYVVFVGLVILSCIKSSKYVFFDTSKERAYIPLDDESKTNGKAAIDAIGSRLAKGLSAVCISGVLTPIYGSIDKAANVSFLMVFVLIFFWIIAVLALNPEYEKKLKQQNS